MTHYLNRNDRLRTVVKNSNGLYCTERQINKERVFIPIEPQPDDSEILELHRLYQNLVACQKGEPQFKRRFAWIEKVPINMPAIQTNVAVVEYIGEFPKRLMHGNVKKKENNTVYVRTKDSVIEDLKNQLKNDTVKTVARQMNLTTKDDFGKQRNDKQLRNLKHSINRAKKDHSETSNAADHVICVEEMTKSHPFVKTVKHISGINYPVVTLYTDQQIADIKRFCCKEGGSVLGMDKTFNLGEFHVTPTVYRDLSVVRRERNDGNPICIGPTFIHTSSTTKAYSSFMHDIADNFTDTELENLFIGTDEEAAFKSAISRCFPMSTHVLCSRHLKQNVNRHLEDQVGYPLRDRQDVLSKLFGEDGLAASKDIDTYNHRVSRIRELVNDKDSRVGEKKFQPYLDNKLLPLLSKHVAEPARNRKIPYNWTSNNSESANHIMKKAVQWRIHDMPTFIKKLYSIVKGEQIERVRAIRGQGSFRLDTNFTHHLVDIDQWGSISDEQKERREARFLKDKGKTHPTIVVSTDGQRTVQIPASAGKKKNQTKRKRPDRTFTPRAKRKLHDINEDKD